MSLVGSEVPPGTASSDDRDGGGREIDTRGVVERALGDALREVTLKYDDIEREKNGGADLNSNSYDMAAHEALLANPRRRAARSPLSTPPGTSPRITTRSMLSPRRF